MATKKRGRPRMYNQPPKILAVPLPEPVHNHIKQTAAQRGMSASALVRRYLAGVLPGIAPTPRHERQLVK